jgi:phosphotransferase system HPr-like phosphotransfer protein
VAAAKFSSAVPLTVGASEADAKSVLGVMGPAGAPGGSEAQQCLRVELLRLFGAGLSGQLNGF